MLDYDELTKKLYQENINWVYSIVKNLDEQGVERKETFIQDAYVLNDVIVLGYYFMNLYIVSNLNNYSKKDRDLIMSAIIKGASSYNQYKLSHIYNLNIDLKKIVEVYNYVVKQTKAYAPDDGLKARVVAIDTIYRKIYPRFNKRHFMVFLKVFMASFNEYENHIQETIDDYLNKDV